MVPRAIVIQNGTHLNQSFDDNSLLGASDRHGHGIPMLHISNIGRSLIERHSDQYLQHSPSSDDLVYILNQSDVQNSEVFHINPNKSQYFGNHLKLTSMPLTKTDSADVDMKRLKTLNGLDVSTDSSMLTTTSLADVTTAHSETTDITEPTTANWTTRLPPSISTIKPAIDMISSAPDLRLIILFPLPFFLMTSLIRKVRYIAPLTSIATAALAVGAFSVLGFIIKSFRVADDFSWWKFRSLPLFLGQLIGAYEGIGCVIPIQSSMEGNRHLFPWFIHGAVTIVFFILCSFGALGYLVYGDTVSQIIVTNIAQHSLLAVLVDVTLVVSVLFTYPLQCFPVIEILETYLFSTGKCCGPRPQPREYEEISSHISDTPDDTSLLHERSVEMSADRVSSVIQPSVPAWKRNFVRILLSLISVGVAVLLRDAYAYISAFSGAVGASLLALIFPCLIHLSLKWDNLSMANKIKDYSIIAFAGVSSILTVVVIMFKMVKSGL